MPLPLRRIYHPAVYQGPAHPHGYFEGWYFKLVGPGGADPMALIPGVAYPTDAAPHSFVQFFRAGRPPRYHSLPIETFEHDSSRGFEVRVGRNSFSDRAVMLDIDDDLGSIRGWVRFGPWSPWPVTLLAPGVMGPFRFVPGMQTYHGILSMDHSLAGSLDVDGERIDFEGGAGYAEKDWGTGFPSSWVWVQCNHFVDERGERIPGASLSLSVARVPFATGAFSGFIAGMLVGGELVRFTTYTGARLECVRTEPCCAYVVLADRRHRLEMYAEGSSVATLAAPVLGSMSSHDEEALDGTVHVVLSRAAAGGWEPIFAASGTPAGVESMDPTGELTTGERG